MLKCKEVTRAIAGDELATADWRRRLSVRLHLLVCRHCRRYARQLRIIGEAARHVFGSTTPDSPSRQRLRRSILDRIPPDQPENSDRSV
jgi:hypothetical protein